ncbi:MAG: acetyl-CoA C-acyltransferase, partial [Clostridia bacterium]
MEKIYIAAARRSAVGTLLGSLTNVAASDLGATVVKTMLSDAGINVNIVDEVIVGNVLSAGMAQGCGRQVAIKSGISETVCAYSVNMICGSGLKAVLNAYNGISAGFSRVVIAGGTEVMSGAPYLIPKNVRQGIKMGDIKVTDHMVLDGLTDAFSGVHMGITAENIAAKYSITRQEQDEFSYNSIQKAIKAVDGGVFDDEIVPIEVKNGKVVSTFCRDEHPNRKSTPEKLASLRPSFKEDGTVTAGNASGLNDGAAFVVVASQSAVEEFNLTPLCEIIGIGQGGVNPQDMGLGPVPAIKNALKMSNLTLSDMEIIELNEAFAAQSLGVIKELTEYYGIDKQKLMSITNINGGAIALGHPI